MLRLAGGGVIKKHLKPAEALRTLKARASHHYDKLYNDTASSVYNGSDMPEVIRPMLNPLIEEIGDLRTQELGVITRTLKAMDRGKIKELIEIAQDKTSTRNSEAKIIKMVQNAWPHLDTLECAKHHISAVQASPTKAVVEIYAEEFHSYKGGEAVFNNGEFCRIAQKELDMREGASEARSEEPARNCTVQ